MKTEGVVWLEKIKDGSILKELTECSELISLGLKETEEDVMRTVLYFNEMGRFPGCKHLKESLGLSEGTIRKNKRSLKEDKLLFDVTSLEVFSVFGYFERHNPMLPDSIYRAVWNRLEKSKYKSWDTLLKNPRAPNNFRYYVSLISKNGNPAFRSAFDFLPYLQTEPLSV